MYSYMNHHVPLLLKLAGAAAAGTAALLSFLHHHQLSTLHSLRRSILHALHHLPGGAALPPAILIIGFRQHEKSAFINTACRALAGEEGPIVLRSDKALPAMAGRLVVTALCGCGGWVEEEEVVVVEFIDAKPFPEPSVATPAEMEKVIDGADEGGGGDRRDAAALALECVVMVMKCSQSERQRRLAFRRLTEIAGVVRDRGLHLLIVLSNKKSLRNCKQEELKHEVSFTAGTDCVYFIENYTARCSTKCQAKTDVKNDFDTHFTALTIIRQCIEFAAQHRRQASQKMINLAAHVNEK